VLQLPWFPTWQHALVLRRAHRLRAAQHGRTFRGQLRYSAPVVVNHLILTRYRGADDNIGFHSDKTRDFAVDTPRSFRSALVKSASFISGPPDPANPKMQTITTHRFVLESGTRSLWASDKCGVPSLDCARRAGDAHQACYQEEKGRGCRGRGSCATSPPQSAAARPARRPPRPTTPICPRPPARPRLRRMEEEIHQSKELIVKSFYDDEMPLAS
jgi:hypothetical protein